MQLQHARQGFPELQGLCSNGRGMIVQQGFLVANAKYNEVHCVFTFLR